METISAEKFAEILPNLDAESVVADVRETDEYEELHIKNSINIPLSSIGKGLAELKKYKTVYLICETGGRSRYAKEALETAGIKTININNGLMAVKMAGVSLVEATR
jgi:phage shock protein E